MTFARHSIMFVLLIDREQEVGLNGEPQARWSDCARLAVADAAQPGDPIFGILRTRSLLWLLLGQSLNSVHNRMANLNIRSQDIKN